MDAPKFKKLANKIMSCDNFLKEFELLFFFFMSKKKREHVGRLYQIIAQQEISGYGAEIRKKTYTSTFVMERKRKDDA